MWILLILAIFLPDDTTFLILKNGKRIKLAQPYEIDGNLVLFRTKADQLLRLPLKQVDLKASQTATEEYHRSRKIRQTPVEDFAVPNDELPDEYFKKQEAQSSDQVYDFSAFKERAFVDDTNYFDFKAAWKLFEEGQSLQKNRLVSNEDQKSLKVLLQHYSAHIWKCKASEKNRDVDELTLEDIKRRLKGELEEKTAQLQASIAKIQAKLPKKP